jgi:hypothetical protein
MVKGGTSMQERKMRALSLALATSATVFVTGVTEVAASDSRYCIQGENFAGGAQLRESLSPAHGPAQLVAGVDHIGLVAQRCEQVPAAAAELP